MPKATSVTPGTSASQPRKRAASKTSSAERNAAKVVSSARHEAERARAEAEDHARRLILDARATADGVRAEGMEVVSNLRQISNTLRELSDRVLADVEAIHARMIGELGAVDPALESASADAQGELDVPDFVARG